MPKRNHSSGQHGRLGELHTIGGNLFDVAYLQDDTCFCQKHSTRLMSMSCRGVIYRTGLYNLYHRANSNSICAYICEQNQFFNILTNLVCEVVPFWWNQCLRFQICVLKIELSQSWTSLCRVWHVYIQMSRWRRLAVWLCHFDSFVVHVASLIKWRVGSVCKSARAEPSMPMVLSGSCKKWRSVVCFGAASDPLLGQGGAFKLQRHRAQSSRFGRLRQTRRSQIFGELAAQGITAGYREGFGVTFGSEHGDIQAEPSQAGIVPPSNSERPWSCVPQWSGWWPKV